MNMVYVTRTGKKVYHDDFCPYIAKKENLIVLGESVAEERGYRPCKFCFSSKGIVFKCRHIIGVQSIYDPVDDAVCFRTKVGFWKVIWRDNIGKWHLFHLNSGKFDPNAKSKNLMRRSFHRQYDLRETESIDKVLRYILEHDKSMFNSEGDYRKLPKNTKKQKRYYNQAKKRAKRKSVRNVYKLLDQIKMEGEI